MRLGSMGDEAHLRLALLMLDSAAELMLHHWTTWPLHEAATYSRMLPMYEKMHEATGTGAGDLVEIRAKALSSTRRRKIEREFGAKCDYLRDRGQLSDAQVRVLRRLHEYRNEAYHQDHLRPSTLASAVRIYTYLVCVMIREFSPGFWSYCHDDPRPGLRKYLDEGECGIELIRLGPKLPARISAELLARSRLTEAMELGRVLADHVSDRVDGIERSARSLANDLGLLGVKGDWDLEATLALAQASAEDLGRIRSPEDARAVRGAVCVATLKEWRAAGRALAAHAEDVAAFAAFAGIEESLESIEAVLDENIMAIEHELEMRSGK